MESDIEKLLKTLGSKHYTEWTQEDFVDDWSDEIERNPDESVYVFDYADFPENVQTCTCARRQIARIYKNLDWSIRVGGGLVVVEAHRPSPNPNENDDTSEE